MKLPTQTEPGYGERQLPATEFATNQQLTRGELTAVLVWVYSREDERINKNLESGVFQDEGCALALKKFKALKLDLDTVRDPKLRRAYGKTPCFMIIDPAAKQVAKLAGKGATSRSRFKGFVGKAWTQLYKMPQKQFVKAMTGILNRLDSIDGKLTVLKTKKARLAKRPNRSKQKALDAEERELNEAKAKIEKDEEAIKKRCALKDKYQPKDEKGVVR